MIVLMFGPPGSGKGTQAAFLAEKFKLPAISTGDIFRAECEAGTELGKMASAIMKSGGLITDDITNAVVANRISKPDCAHGFLLDGYPRTVAQAQYLSALLRERGLPEPIVIHLDVGDEALVTRLSARRQCPRCKRIYNLLSQPPRFAGICDADGFGLIRRQDDEEVIIRERLRAYNQLNGPILSWYGPARVRKVDGAMTPEAVRDAIERALSEMEQQSSVPA